MDSRYAYNQIPFKAHVNSDPIATQQVLTEEQNAVADEAAQKRMNTHTDYNKAMLQSNVRQIYRFDGKRKIKQKNVT